MYFVASALNQCNTDTKSCLIHKSEVYTMHGERQVCLSKVEWAAWTPRYVQAQYSNDPCSDNTPQDLFSQLFGGGFGGGSFFGGGARSQGVRRTKDLVHRVNVTLEDLYKGKTTKLALTRNVICNKCKGKGGKDGAVKTCNSCSGRGVRITLRQMGPMIQQIQAPCDDCGATGEVINAKDRCHPTTDAT